MESNNTLLLLCTPFPYSSHPCATHIKHNTMGSASHASLYHSGHEDHHTVNTPMACFTRLFFYGRSAYSVSASVWSSQEEAYTEIQKEGQVYTTNPPCTRSSTDLHGVAVLDTWSGDRSHSPVRNMLPLPPWTAPPFYYLALQVCHLSGDCYETRSINPHLLQSSAVCCLPYTHCSHTHACELVDICALPHAIALHASQGVRKPIQGKYFPEGTEWSPCPQEFYPQCNRLFSYGRSAYPVTASVWSSQEEAHTEVQKEEQVYPTNPPCARSCTDLLRMAVLITWSGGRPRSSFSGKLSLAPFTGPPFYSLVLQDYHLPGDRYTKRSIKPRLLRSSAVCSLPHTHSSLTHATAPHASQGVHQPGHCSCFPGVPEWAPYPHALCQQCDLWYPLHLAFRYGVHVKYTHDSPHILAQPLTLTVPPQGLLCPVMSAIGESIQLSILTQLNEVSTVKVHRQRPFSRQRQRHSTESCPRHAPASSVIRLAVHKRIPTVSATTMRLSRWISSRSFCASLLLHNLYVLPITFRSRSRHWRSSRAPHVSDE